MNFDTEEGKVWKTEFFININQKMKHSRLQEMIRGAYVVSGPGIERAFLMTDFNRDASVRRSAQQMRSMGGMMLLRERGCKNGDTVKDSKGEFEFVE